ncbi:biopolymer transporter ExbD [Subsaximicrobium wynnwilliamsii]|uniref:Biopolymer transporter ExbD n=1 Tax=Subsaximicrobium wynnwilliamsii TaxID=291179 RepID=A0A5C6ZIZ5_9FLAO|nr:biopolymer transporter ExbD [Subsaximicrobium wynnwilliamsii]TXD82906.1 biopolymer transporter ExbD [Subsaximicrobium wynnwilliamsii]TXD88628.1 biopolymer transporter ExbD [Subsaximicrobium wynnwilliamsii]TXE02720.1 biopolymer transporter ExbD [Subsaximicrobium wynnwilliamsii]
MKNSRRYSVEVNAGSMTDIAFLLLIFFLVTAVIPKDKGISRTLPSDCPPGVHCNADIAQRNLLQIYINSEDQLMVDNQLVFIAELKALAVDFLDNNGDSSCDYCSGLGTKTSSDNPSKAVISLRNDKLTSYNFYIAVQDELSKAYYELRTDYAKSHFNKNPDELNENELKTLREVYPFLLSEAALK